MEPKAGNRQEQRGIENTVLILFSAFHVACLVLCLCYRWPVYQNFIILAALGISWWIHFRKAYDFTTRACICTALLQLSLIIFGGNISDLYPIMMVLLVLMVATGLYGVPYVILFYVITGVADILVHFLYYYPEQLQNWDDIISKVLPSMLIFVVIGVLFIWLKNRQASQKKMMRMVQELKSAEASKTEFLANVTHEIGTPVHIICGMSEALQQETDPQQQKENIAAIQTAGQNLMAVVHNMSDYSAIQTGHLALENHPYEVEQLLRRMMEMVHTATINDKLKMSLTIEGAVPKILWGDEEKVQRILFSSVNNALKFTEEGEVAIQVSSVPRGKMMLLQFCIKDTGVGFPPEDLERLNCSEMKPGLNIPHDHADVSLGILIMKELLRIMDGDMQIQSQRGKGTTVMIQIPQRKINEDLINGVDLPGEAVGKASREQSPDARLSAPDARILVVDDNRMNLQVMERLLKQYDVQVVTAASGKESLERIADGGFDLVFMDHMMPEMDGVETLHAIRQMPGEYFKQVPIVALTANTVTGAREALLAEGFDDFVDKPIRSQRLDSLLQQYLPTEKREYASHPEARQAETPAVDKSVSDRLFAGAGNGITPNSTKKLSDLKFLNVELACTYCESEQVYRDVLKDYGKRGEKNWTRLESLYAAEDWKNYTIEVHGIKSSMLAIGAQSLSAKAKELETAGRQGDITFIREHHDAMLKEFKEVITSIQAFFGMAVETKKPAPVVERTVSLPELSEEMITTFLQKMEKATYDFDELEMKSCVMQLRGYAHKGHSLDETISEVVRKIEMSDYMSAYDCLVHQLTDD